MKHNIQQLNDLYRKADDKDSNLFSEMKSNVLLVNSEHYKHIEKRLRDRANDYSVTEKQKIRITKNHTQRITNRFKNGILGLSPDVKCYPANTTELQDKKAAELYDSVLEYGKNRYKLTEHKEDWCDDFVDFGEVAVKVYFNKNIGDIVGYEQKVIEGQAIFEDQNGEETLEQYVLDPLTQMPIAENKPFADKDKPVFSGDFEFEEILPFNLLRDPSTESMQKSPYLIVRKMIDKEEVEKMIPEDDEERDEKLSWVKKSAETTYKVFDTDRASYVDGDNKIMLREYYFRPCMKYPRGYFYITTEYGVLFKGELPFGVFPIAWRGFKKIQSSARARSVIKVIRPYQYEINRAASKEVEHQLVHGDDKIITPPGGKISQGAIQPGIRQIHAVGTPTVIQGRTGEQFVGYIQRTIEEMYQVIDEPVEDQDTGQQTEAFTLLYRSLKRKQKYGRYAKEFQAFLKDVYWIYLQLAREYFDESRYIKAVGRSEQINFKEFKTSDPLSVSIKLIEDTEDSETLMGKLIQFNFILQYVGKDLPKESLGKILSNLPYANKDQVFSDLVADSKNIENDLLAMDRGEKVEASPDDQNDLYIKAITARIKSPDFRILPPEIQQNYMAWRDEHRAIQAEKEKQILLAQRQAIPSGGNLVKVDMYRMENGKQVRATYPDEALKWLEEKLKEQGLAQERLASMASVDQAMLAQQMMIEPQQMAPQMPNQGGMIGPNGEQF